MSPGHSSAPRSFTAAFAGVSQPFATRPWHQQQESPPTDGSDSFYGVRSLEGSVSEWGMNEVRDRTESSADTAEAITPSSISHDDAQLSQPDATMTPVSVIEGTATSEGLMDVNRDVSKAMDESSSGTLIDHISRSLPQRENRTRPIVSPPTRALFEALAEPVSEPSSPASFTSLPSYVASLSSVSRTSSPTGWDYRHHNHHPLSLSARAFEGDDDDDHNVGVQAGLGIVAHELLGSGGSEDLVLPTLCLPSTSLHLGLDQWHGAPTGTRVALIASPEHARDVLCGLGAVRRLVQLSRREIGVIREGELEATILTGLLAPGVRDKVDATYASLQALLNPVPPPADRHTELEAMIGAYTTSSDWVHLVIVLEDESNDSSDATQLAAIVPVVTVPAEIETIQPTQPTLSTEPSRMATPSPPAVDNTPRWIPGSTFPVDNLSPHNASEPDVAILATESISPSGPSFGRGHNDRVAPTAIQDAIALLEHVLDNPDSVRAASTAAFLTWRPLPPSVLSASRTPTSSLTAASTSPASSTFDVRAGPMPTVARAQGGGEWEATLSRRLAQRREIDAATHRTVRGYDRGRGRVRRRRSPHSPEGNRRNSCSPLFPGHLANVSNVSSVGLPNLLAKAFVPVRRAFRRSPWQKVLVACALAVAVGCGYWASRAG